MGVKIDQNVIKKWNKICTSDDHIVCEYIHSTLSKKEWKLSENILTQSLSLRLYLSTYIMFWDKSCRGMDVSWSSWKHGKKIQNETVG